MIYTVDNTFIIMIYKLYIMWHNSMPFLQNKETFSIFKTKLQYNL